VVEAKLEFLATALVLLEIVVSLVGVNEVVFTEIRDVIFGTVVY